MKAAVALTALTAGMVKFAPSTFADTSCDVFIGSIPSPQCEVSCIGCCSQLRSICQYNYTTGIYCAIECGGFCYPAQAVAICYSDGSGICCAHYC